MANNEQSSGISTASAPAESVTRPATSPTESISGWRGLFAHRFGGVCIALAAALAINAITRIALAIKDANQVSWDASIARAFFYGTIYDLAASL